MAQIFNLLWYKTNSNPLCIGINDDYVLLDNNTKYYISDTIEKCHENIEFFNAFHDYPYSYNYEYIYNNFKDTKFILTLRDSDKWFNSLYTYQNIEGAVNYKVLNNLYDYPKILLENKENIINKYNNYNKNIQDFFKDKMHLLLIINICDDESDNKNITHNKIENFLNVNINFDLPHLNKQ